MSEAAELMPSDRDHAEKLFEGIAKALWDAGCREDHDVRLSYAVAVIGAIGHHRHSQPEGWKPIATAPRDGTRILIWDSQPYIATWSEEAHFGGFEDRAGWQIFSCEEDEFYAAASDSATHWTELPSPPVILAAQEG